MRRSRANSAEVRRPPSRGSAVRREVGERRRMPPPYGMASKVTIGNIPFPAREALRMTRFATAARLLRGGLALLFVLALGACGQEDTPRVRLATTTSARDTGLLDWVLPEVEKKAGLRVSVVAVGTGQALELGRKGDADLVLVHDRPQEDKFVADGHGVDRRDLMWNDFVIVGPDEDPAGIRGGKDGVAALRRVHE